MAHGFHIHRPHVHRVHGQTFSTPETKRANRDAFIYAAVVVALVILLNVLGVRA